MTQYLENFSGGSLAGFTEQWTANNTWSVQTKSAFYGGKAALNAYPSPNTDGHCLFSYDAVNSDSNRDNAHVRIRFVSYDFSNREPGIVVRGSGTSVGSETGYYAALKYVSSSDYRLAIYRLNSGTSTELASSALNLDLDLGNPLFRTAGFHSVGYFERDFAYNLEFKVEDSDSSTVSLYARLWKDGYEEPSDWTVTHDDTSGSRITGTGWIGIYRYDVSRRFYVDYISVGTNGDSYQAETIDTGTTLRIHGTFANVLYTGTPTVPAIETYERLPEQSYDITVGDLYSGAGDGGYYGFQVYGIYDTGSEYNDSTYGKCVSLYEYTDGSSPSWPGRSLIYLHDNTDPTKYIALDFYSLLFDIYDNELIMQFQYEDENYNSYTPPVQNPNTNGYGHFYHELREGFNSFEWIDFETSTGTIRINCTDLRDGGHLASGWVTRKTDNAWYYTLQFFIDELWDSADFGQVRRVTFEGFVPQEPSKHYYRVRTTMS